MAWHTIEISRQILQKHESVQIQVHYHVINHVHSQKNRGSNKCEIRSYFNVRSKLRSSDPNLYSNPSFHSIHNNSHNPVVVNPMQQLFKPDPGVTNVLILSRTLGSLHFYSSKI